MNKANELYQLLVGKLGGTPLCDGPAIENSVLSMINSGHRYLVVSAPGKSGLCSEKITDVLFGVDKNMQKGESIDESINKIIHVFSRIASHLGISLEAMDFVSTGIVNNIKRNPYRDYIVSRGEYIQANLITLWLNKIGIKATFVDSADCIFFHKDGSVNYHRTYPAIRHLCEGSGVFIISGYYGRGHDGKIRVFTRDGSDFSGALVSVALNASLYNMGKDTLGFCTANPTTVDGVQVIPELNFWESRALVYAGSTVIHPLALSILAEHNIPCRVFNPVIEGSTGTLISSSVSHKESKPLSIVGKNSFAMFHMQKMLMNEEIGYASSVLEVFRKLNVAIDHMPTGIDSMAVLVDQEKYPTVDYKDRVFFNKSIISGLEKALPSTKITVNFDVAVIAVVCTGESAHYESIICKLLTQHKIWKYSSQSIDNQIIVSVYSGFFHKAVKIIHEAFFEKNERLSKEVFPEPCAR